MLYPLIIKFINPGTEINSDCFKSYEKINQIGLEDECSLYTHFSVNHSINFVDPITQTHTNNIEGFFSKFRKFFRKSSRKRNYLSSYIDEFLFRWNYLKNENEKFEFFLKILFLFDLKNN